MFSFCSHCSSVTADQLEREATVISPSADLHDVWKSHQPLGVACNHCQHRALVARERIDARQGNSRCVDTLKFRCTKCKRHNVELHLFLDHRSARRFMAEYR